MSEWDQTGTSATPRPRPGWDTGVPADPARQDRTLRGLAAAQTVFGRYRLERVLGQGGMGVVWLAGDGELGQWVALKFLPEAVMFDPAALEDLRAETRRSLRLTHPNIVRVHDFVREQARPLAAISMELIEGQTLSARRMGRPNRVFEARELLPWVRQLCAALDYAHGQGMVHRDLKPANLMVDAAGNLKVCDFGIACSLRDSVTRATGRLPSGSGTLVYMSPQQMMGEDPAVTDDVYAIGATLFELLTGKPPFFRGDVAEQVKHKVPEPMAQRRASTGVVGEPIPAQWEAVVAGCLDKDAGKRPQSAGDVVARLEARGAGLEGRAARATAPNDQHSTTNVQGMAETPTEHGKPKSGKRRAVGIALVFALALAGGAGWWFGVEVLRRETERAGHERWLAAEADRKAEEARKAAAPEKARLEQERLAREEAQRQQALEAERQRMEALTGTVEVRSEPPGAAVIGADGRRLGVTPLKLDKVPAGEVTVRLEIEGYEPAEARGTVVGGRQTALSMTLKRAVAGPATATKERPFENSLGMSFVPAGTPGVLFCVWETRVKDYEAYARENLGVDGSWRNPGFEQGLEHPVVGVSWEDARAFCAWLTRKERAAGRIGPNDEYRLPSDHEWSVAVGIGDRENPRASPKEKDKEVEGVYPWGTQWPPPRGAGNYSQSLNVDAFGGMAPVGSFAPNGFAVYDLGGNAWEWCQDLYEAGKEGRVLRGASWNYYVETVLRSSFRDYAHPGYRREYNGFRCVLSASGS